MGGGGGIAICGGEVSIGGCGGRWKRWRDDDGVEVGDSSGACLSLRAQPFIAVPLAGLPYPSSPACDWNGNPNCASETTTLTPKPPKHGTNQWCRGRDTCASCGRGASCSLNASCTQPRPARLGAGGGGGCQRLAQAYLDGTPHGHRSSGPKSLAAEDDHPTGRGAGIPSGGSDRSVGRLRAHSHAKVAGGGRVGIKDTVSRCGM